MVTGAAREAAPVHGFTGSRGGFRPLAQAREDLRAFLLDGLQRVWIESE
jgi:hypothetical protein